MICKAVLILRNKGCYCFIGYNWKLSKKCYKITKVSRKNNSEKRSIKETYNKYKKVEKSWNISVGIKFQRILLIHPAFEFYVTDMAASVDCFYLKTGVLVNQLVNI